MEEAIVYDVRDEETGGGQNEGSERAEHARARQLRYTDTDTQDERVRGFPAPVEI
jgi:hypothetical protein